MHLSFRLALLAAATLTLAGCSTDFAAPSANFNVEGLRGTMMGGQQPVTSAIVYLYAVAGATNVGNGSTAGNSGYGAAATLLATATTGPKGQFTFGAFSCPTSNTPMYLLARGGNSGFGGSNPNIVMASAAGSCGNLAAATVNINEVTTVATAFALSHFFTSTLGSGSTDSFGGAATYNTSSPSVPVYNQGLVNAGLYTVPLLVDLTQGDATQAARVTTTSGSLTITRETAKLLTLANILASCVNSTGQTSTTETTTNCGKLFSYTRPPGASTRPSDTLQAAVQMALYPYQNVSSLFSLPPASSPFVGLSSTPNDWTLGVSYTSSTLGLAVNSNTSSSLEIDANGNIWLPSNATRSGVAEFSPASTSFSNVYAGLLHPQYVTITRGGIIYASDMSSARLMQISGSTVSTIVTQANTGALSAGSDANSQDTIYYASGSTFLSTYNLSGSLLGTAQGSINALAGYPLNFADQATGAGSTPCRYETTNSPSNGMEGVVATTSSSPCIAGGMAVLNGDVGAVMTTSVGQLCQYGQNVSGGNTPSCFVPPVSLTNPRAIAIDGDNNLWIANSSTASVSTLKNTNITGASQSTSDYQQTSPIPYLHGSSYGGTMTTPYGIGVDRSGNVWISNAGCTTTSCTPGALVLSELIGAAAPTITPIATATTASINGTRPQTILAPVQSLAAPGAGSNPSGSSPIGRRARR